MRRNDDSWDDGGTPMYRRRQAQFAIDARRHAQVTIDASRRPRLTFGRSAMLIVFAGYVLPWVIIFGGLALVGLWDALFRG